MFAVKRGYTRACRHVQLPSHRNVLSLSHSQSRINIYGLRLKIPIFFYLISINTYITLNSTNHDLYIVVHIGYLCSYRI